MEETMLELNDAALKVVAGGWGSFKITKINVDKNVSNIKLGGVLMEDSAIVINVTQKNY